MDRRFFGLCIVLLLVLIASNEEMVVEAKVCQSMSRYFKGHCNRDHICAVVCRDSGWSGGRCQHYRRSGFRHHRFARSCFCTKLC